MARQKGATNIANRTAKENVLAVFTRLGGTAAMAEWAKANMNEFYRIYAKLVPQEVKSDVQGSLTLTVTTGVPEKQYLRSSND